MDNNTNAVKENATKDMVKVHGTYMNHKDVKERFDSVLGENAASYMTSVLNIIKGSNKLQECVPVSVWNAALCSATMHLPLDSNLGYACIVPYKDNKNKVQLAQFQIMSKGYVQLALRTGEYVAISKSDVREGEIKKRNRLTGQIEFDWIEDENERLAAPIIGYVSYFELKNGFSSTLYMSMEELMAHAVKYSKMYQNDLKYGSKSSKWSIPEERGAMCEKTVLKLNLSKNGILSIEMQRAMNCDNAVIGENGEPEYIDRTDDENKAPDKSPADEFNAEFGKIFEVEGTFTDNEDEAVTAEADKENGNGIDKG